ncbi:MAG: aspartate aminotransferase family protein [Candidatus Diapherotrites archaeon]|nr:aspartate aminotransferase family protein [Candidatus Diapherotrites archaeon]
MNELMELENLHSTGLYPKRPIQLVRGKGTKVWDSEGKELIDCGTGIGVAAFGHCNEFINNAIKKQLDTLATCHESFYNDTRAKAMQKLLSFAPKNLQKVFFSNSGAEAIEAGIKISRAVSKKTEILSATHGFHGRTYGALSATWKKAYREPFEPLVPDFKFFEYNSIESFKEAVSEKTAAVIIEPIQGEAGVIPADKEFLKAMREICTQKNIFLIADEIQCGFGRTGKFFAFEHYGIQPDIITLGKPIAGGIPMAATILRSDFELPEKSHGSTFGGNPLACSAMLACLEFISKENLLEKISEKGDRFLQGLRGINSPIVREVRGKGLMIGVELKRKASDYLKALNDEGVIAMPSGTTTLRFLPPYTISNGEIDSVLKAVEKVLK